MRKLLLAGTAGAVLLAAGSANAADLGVRPSYKAPPIIAPIPIFSWTGCYVGAHVGGGWGRKDFSNPGGANFFAAGGEVIRIDTSGFLGGGQVGCDWQFAPNWVIGIEGAAAWADLKGDTLDTFVFAPGDTFTTTGTLHARTDFLASVTGRVGWAWDRWMLYAKGGIAWDHDKYSFPGQFTCVGNCFLGPGPFPFDFAASESRTGWTAGAGAEWTFWNNWSAKIEYDFYDFGNRRVTLIAPSTTVPMPSTFPADINQQIHTVKFGINYRFGWGKAPVVARY